MDNTRYTRIWGILQELSKFWRVERGRYSFEPPQKVNHLRKADEVLYQARWLFEKGETEEAENIWESFLKDEIHNPQRFA